MHSFTLSWRCLRRCCRGGGADRRGRRSIGVARRGARSARLSVQPLEPKLALAAPSAPALTLPPAGSYGPGDELVFRVTYAEAVDVEGTPGLAVTIGRTVRTADYVGGSGSPVLAFRHVVAAGENDADGIAVGRRIELPSGARITAASSEPATLHFRAPRSSRVVVDTRAPVVAAIVGPAARVHGEGSVLAFTARFDEGVFVTGIPTLPVEIAGVIRDATWDGGGSGTGRLTFTTVVRGGDVDADGVRVVGPVGFAGGAAIRDRAGNDAVAAAAASFPAVTVKAVAPQLTTIDVVATAPGVVTLRAGFTEPVVVRGTPLLPFRLDGQERVATFVGGSGSAALLFRHRQAGITVRPDLVTTPFTPQLPEGASIRDRAGNLALWPATLSSTDIFHLEWAENPQVSPGGGHVAYVRVSNDVSSDTSRRSVWLVDLASGVQRPLPQGIAGSSQPVWSPDGGRIAYVARRADRTEIRLFTVASGKDVRLGDGAGGPSGLTWSPDGTRLAFTMEVAAPPTDFVAGVELPLRPADATWADPAEVYERAAWHADGRGFLTSAYRQVFVMAAGGGAARQVTSGPFNSGDGLTFTPDGTGLVFTANLSPDWEYQALDGDLYRLDLAGGGLTRLTTLPGLERSPVYSPDGRRLAFIWTSNDTVPYRNGKLKLLESDSGVMTDVAPGLDLDLSAPEWFGEDRLLVHYEERGLSKVGTLSLDGELAPLVETSGVGIAQPYTSGEYHHEAGLIAFTRGRADRPADLFLWERGRTRQLTALNEDVLGHKKLGGVHEIRYASSFDGEAIQGWYITPPDFDPSRRYPLVVEIHGGPHLAYGPHFSAEMQRLAAEGYVVFYDNHRGSSGYGERFALLLDGKYSSPEDYADHDSGVDALIAMGFIDDRNLFISGGSAGGTATAYAIGLTDRYRAAAVFKPVINWTSKVLVGDNYLYQTYHQFPGPPWEHLEEYWRRSPISLAGGMKTPTMILTGEEDRRTPIGESEQLYQALKLEKVPAALVRIPGASHGIANRPSRMIAKIQHTVAWFALYREA